MRDPIPWLGPGRISGKIGASEHQELKQVNFSDQIRKIGTISHLYIALYINFLKSEQAVAILGLSTEGA